MAEEIPTADASAQRLRRIIDLMREVLNACEAALDEIELDAREGLPFDEHSLREMVEALGGPSATASSSESERER